MMSGTTHNLISPVYNKVYVKAVSFVNSRFGYFFANLLIILLLLSVDNYSMISKK